MFSEMEISVKNKNIEITKDELAKKLYQVILSIETEEECEQFFEDLCSPNELSALKQRFAVAAMLKQDKVYNEIFQATGAGTGTISRVKRMMNYGSGCMTMLMDRVDMREQKLYIMNKDVGVINATVEVPGSKSVTNRALLIAALSKEETVLEGVLFSDDSRHFIESLISLGYDISVDEQDKRVKIKGTGGNIPNHAGEINVGSAGTAARFLTAMLALSAGEYTINCSEQMEKRPMQPLFDVLIDLGADFTYLKKEGFLPVKVKGNNKKSKDIIMDISKSTQFLSAMLMVTPVLENDIKISISSDKKIGSYVEITIDMLKDFGVDIEFDGESYHVKGNQHIKGGNYIIEPDVSAACYFYAAAAITGGSVTVRNIKKGLMQGDMKFLEVLQTIGCTLEETSEGIKVIGPKDGVFDGIDVDMNNFSDQALTLSVVAVFANTPTRIRNIGHIRGQECNRMSAIVNELGKCGIKAEEIDDDIIIYPGKLKPAMIETYDDHRVAMAFTLLSLKEKGIKISNPMCCKKTFENFYEEFEKMCEGC